MNDIEYKANNWMYIEIGCWELPRRRSLLASADDWCSKEKEEEEKEGKRHSRKLPND